MRYPLNGSCTSHFIRQWVAQAVCCSVYPTSFWLQPRFECRSNMASLAGIWHSILEQKIQLMLVRQTNVDSKANRMAELLISDSTHSHSYNLEYLASGIIKGCCHWYSLKCALWDRNQSRSTVIDLTQWHCCSMYRAWKCNVRTWSAKNCLYWEL